MKAVYHSRYTGLDFQIEESLIPALTLIESYLEPTCPLDPLIMLYSRLSEMEKRA